MSIVEQMFEDVKIAVDYKIAMERSDFLDKEAKKRRERELIEQERRAFEVAREKVERRLGETV
jgi:uncharacterized Zn finger protein